MCSLTDFIEMSLGRCGGLVSTATVTGQGASWVDDSVRGGDFSWPKTGTSRGHQRGLQLAKNGDFFMATDTLPRRCFRDADSGTSCRIGGRKSGCSGGGVVVLHKARYERSSCT
jgi:hypothetical protein